MQDGQRPSDLKPATPAECRERAAWLRDRAMALKDPEARAMVLAAEEWDRLALEIEKPSV
jgi:hypothetical protein